MSTQSKRAAEDAAKAEAAERREDYLRGLKEEREGYVRTGNKERLADVDAEIKRFTAKPSGRAAKATSKTASATPKDGGGDDAPPTGD